MKIGLYFGSFNPIHIGHLIIAAFVSDNTTIDQIWFIVSPQNPLKISSTLLNEYHRLYLVQLAIEDNLKFRCVDIEFRLPRPSFTIDTLTHLKEKYPQNDFTVIIGSDSLENIHKWKNSQLLLKHYSFVVYERPGFAKTKEFVANITFLKAPLLEISSTYVRAVIKAGKSAKYLVPDKVLEEIERNNYYRM